MNRESFTCTADDGTVLRGWQTTGGTTALVLLHDLDADSVYWEPMLGRLRALDADLRVIAVDARGHGASDPAKDCSRKRLVKDVKQVCKALGVSDVVLCGHGWGADTALASDFARGVIAINATLGYQHAIPADSCIDNEIPQLRGAVDAEALEACVIGMQRAKPLRRNRRDGAFALLYSAPADLRPETAETLDRLLDLADDAQQWQDGTSHLPLEAPAGVAALVLSWFNEFEETA